MLRFLKNLFSGQRRAISRTSSCPAADSPSSLSAVTDEEGKSKDSELTNIVCSSTTQYRVLNYIDEGQFGKVVKCVDLNTSHSVALKILKSDDSRIATREITMLEKVSVLDPVRKNVVTFLDRFEHLGHTCLAFEMLDRSLGQLLDDRLLKPLSVNEIRPIAAQLLTALDALKAIGIIHSDLKPDNVMLVNHVHEPFRVKLIDFGVAFTSSECTRGMNIQPIGYIAPEVTLGLPISEAIDMWSLGCVLTCLYIGNHPFSIDCQYEMLCDIVKSLGQPPDHLLDAGDFTKKFFKENQLWHPPKWCLKTPTEYQLSTGCQMPGEWTRSFESLDSLITSNTVMQESIQLDDERAFVSLLKCILEMDPKKRITPEEALKHPFISMTHMEAQRDTSMYVNEAFASMLVVPTDEASPVEKADEEAEADEPLTILYEDYEASAAPSCNGDTPPPDDGAAAEEYAALCPEEETELLILVKTKDSRSKRIRKFFSRVIRTVFHRK